MITDERLKKKDEECDYEYYERIGIMRLNREIDLSWDELAILLGGFESGVTYRKSMNTIVNKSKKYYDEKIRKIILDSEQYTQGQLDEIDEKILEIKKEKRKLSDQRNLVNRKINEYARIENMTDIMRNEIRSVYSSPPMIDISKCLETRETSNNDGVLLLSDIHYGIKIDNHWNKYDVDICRERISELISETIEYSKMHNIDKLHLFLLGDLISGTLHSSIRLENQENLMKQIINISKILIDSISILASHLPYVVVNMATGNHERVYAKDENLDGDNYTELIRNNLSIGLEDIPNVILMDNKYGEDIIVSNICGNTIFASHGDKDTLNNAIPRLTSMIKIIPDYMFIGHYHNLKEDTFGESRLIVNGTLSGMDSYAKGKRLYSKPSQRFMVFNKKGRLCTYNIKF